MENNFETAGQERWDFKGEAELRGAYFVLMGEALRTYQIPKHIEDINERFRENAEKLGLSIDPPATVESPQIKEFLGEVQQALNHSR